MGQQAVLLTDTSLFYNGDQFDLDLKWRLDCSSAGESSKFNKNNYLLQTFDQ